MLYLSWLNLAMTIRTLNRVRKGYQIHQAELMNNVLALVELPEVRTTTHELRLLALAASQRALQLFNRKLRDWLDDWAFLNNIDVCSWLSDVLLLLLWLLFFLLRLILLVGFELRFEEDGVGPLILESVVVLVLVGEDLGGTLASGFSVGKLLHGVAQEAQHCGEVCLLLWIRQAPH